MLGRIKKQANIIFVMGRPGAGKDTQVSRLAKEFNLMPFITSRRIKEAIKNGLERDYEDPVAKREKELFDLGFLNTPELVLDLVKNKTKELAMEDFLGHKGIIFNGSPRTIFEAEGFIPFLESLFGKENLKAIYLDVSEEECVRRILARSAKQENSAVDRPFDTNIEDLKTRMRQYENRTKPVLEYLEKRNLLVRVDGSQKEDDVFDSILNIFRGGGQ